MNKPGCKGPALPITSVQRLREIEGQLSPRDRALFVLGIQLGFRGSDLLALNVGDVRHLTSGDPLRVLEGKTSKYRTVFVGPSVIEALKPLLDRPDPAPLFAGEKRGTRLTICTLSRLWRRWTGLGGSQVGRKTFAHQRWKNGASLDAIQQSFGHASGKVTMTYACIPDEAMRKLYLAEV